MRTGSMSRRILSLLATVGLLALLVGAVTAAPASGAPSGSISGLVTGPDGAPTAGVRVEALDWSGRVAATVETIADGTYALAGLVPGSFRVHFLPATGSGLVEQYWNGRPTWSMADSVTVADGVDTAHVDARLEAAGRIVGMVTGPSGEPVAGVLVRATDQAGLMSTHSVESTADGAFAFDGLPPSAWVLELTPPIGTTTYVGQWFDNKPSRFAADIVTATPGATATVAAHLEIGGVLSGTVTADGAALAGVFVHVESPAVLTSRDTTTGADGTYRLTGLPTGGYTVSFSPPLPYAAETYPGRHGVFGDPVPVTVGLETSGIDATLDRVGAMSGRVTNGAGEPVAHVQMTATMQSSLSTWFTTYTASDGSYALDTLQPGAYQVSYSPPAGSGYLPGWYPDSFTMPMFGRVEVAAGATVTGIDATLHTGGGISGRVVGSDGAPMAGVWARATTMSPGGDNNQALTDADGRYTISALWPDTYRVSFDRSGYQPAWYRDRTDMMSADPVTVLDGHDTTGIDAHMVLSGGNVTVMVTTPEGSALVGATVELFGESGNNLGPVTTGEYGMVGFGDAPVGTYTLRVTPPAPFATEWWNDKPDRASADRIDVAQYSFTMLAVEVARDPALVGSMRGTVVGPTGAPLAGVRVEAAAAAAPGTVVSSAITAADGTYTVVNLPTGAYRVTFTDLATGLLPAVYRDKPTPEAPDLVKVTALGTTAGIDAQLRAPAVVHGTVAAGPVGDVTVALTGPFGFREMRTFAAPGGWAFGGLWPGRYTLAVTPAPTSGYQQETRTLDLVDGSDTWLDLALAPAVTTGSISGRVIAPRGMGTGVSVRVVAHSGAVVAGVSAGADGRYTIDGVPADSFTVLAVPLDSGTYLPTYHSNATTLAAADFVQVRAGETVSGVDVTLQPVPKPPVRKAQTITFTTPKTHTVGDAPFPLAARASSGLPVTFASLTPTVCTVSGTTVTVLAAGTCSIRASQAGDTRYRPAPDVTRSFTVRAGKPAGSYATAVAADHPVAWWRLGEGVGVATDATGHGHDGTYIGPTQPTAGAVGRDGAVALNTGGPTNAHVVAPDDGALALAGDLTIEVWLKPMASVGNYQMIVTKSPGASAGSAGVAAADYELWLRPDLRPELRLTVGAGNPIVTADRAVTPGVWTHLVVTRAAGRVAFYLDGAAAGGAGIGTGQVRTNDLPVRIGSRADERVPAYFAFRGAIDEVALYDRALTATQVATHAAAR